MACKNSYLHVRETETEPAYVHVHKETYTVWQKFSVLSFTSVTLKHLNLNSLL